MIAGLFSSLEGNKTTFPSRANNLTASEVIGNELKMRKHQCQQSIRDPIPHSQRIFQVQHSTFNLESAGRAECGASQVRNAERPKCGMRNSECGIGEGNRITDSK